MRGRERALALAGLCLGPLARAVERRVGLELGAAQRLVELAPGPLEVALALLELGAAAAQLATDVGAREPAGDELEVAVDLGRVVAAADQRERPLDHEHREGAPARGHHETVRRPARPLLPHMRRDDVPPRTCSTREATWRR